jgi:hypothetical protein
MRMMGVGKYLLFAPESCVLSMSARVRAQLFCPHMSYLRM